MSEREREARAAEREVVRESLEHERAERKRESQREWLLELQDVLMEIVRTYGEEHHQDVMLSRKAGRWQQYQLGGDISDRNFVATQRKTILTSRIDDEEVRTAVQEMVEAGSGLMFAKSEGESTSMLGLAGNAFTRANDRIGVLLREV